MTRSLLAVFTMVLSLLFVAAPLLSATLDDLVGTWQMANSAKIKVNKIGAWSSENSLVATLNQDGTFLLHEVDSTGSYDYTGTWNLIKDGKKLSVSLDAEGQAELRRVWENWLTEIAHAYGLSISGITFSLENLSISEPGIPKKTDVPNKITIKAKGWVSATVGGDYMTRKFSYTSKVYFLHK